MSKISLSAFVFILLLGGCGTTAMYPENISKDDIVHLSVNNEEVYILNIDNKESISRGKDSFDLAVEKHSVLGALAYTNYTDSSLPGIIMSKHYKQCFFETKRGKSYHIRAEITKHTSSDVDWEMKVVESSGGGKWENVERDCKDRLKGPTK